MVEWFVFAIVAMAASGIQNFGYKLAAEEGCNSATLMSSFLGTTIILAAIGLTLTRDLSVNSLELFLVFAAVNAAGFVVTFLARQEALKLIPLVIGVPLSKMSAAIAAVIGVLFLGESLNGLNAAGIVLSLAVVWLLTRKEGVDGEFKNFGRGIALILVALLASGLSSAALKLATAEGSNLLFVVTTYGMMFFPALFLQERFSNEEEAASRTTLKWGSIIGAVNFISFTSLLAALQTGPMSLVFPITTLGIAISVALSVGMLDERLTPRRVLGILMAILALVLLRI